MSYATLSAFVEGTAQEYGTPGVAVGVWADGQEFYACHGVTSVENPLPVDRDTLFQLGSVTKTHTATAVMRLVEEGRIDLDAPVRKYVPELVLSDERAAADMTVLNLLNHTAGLGWNVIVDTGEGENALADFVARMTELEQLAAPGTRASYSQAGYNLVGRILENVTGLTYEQAIASLVLEPLGLSNSFFAPDDVMTRRFAVGHDFGEDGTLAVSRPWRVFRANNPGGGLTSSVTDLLRWARFHLGDGRAEDGTKVLSAEALHQMKEPTVELVASSLGDAFGIAWFLREVDGVRTVEHGGSARGQFAALHVVPERNFAVVVLNAGPEGTPFNQAVVRWAFENYLGLVEKDPEPLPYDEAWAREVAGAYENDAMTLNVVTDGAGLTIDAVIKPEVRAASETELPADYAPAAMGLLPGDADEYIVTEGGLAGQRGFFSRDESGAIVGIDLAGRLFTRVPAAS
ncbi:serine hydrolase domain-containing protein [Streptomyces sp. NPDC000410]|uniref:serine hydrolase domain-containing protein n=1 Tax=Streptomyces sp. NPDC000410 TaxID=3154254 RepID=UPI003316DAE7